MSKERQIGAGRTTGPEFKYKQTAASGAVKIIGGRFFTR
jgi:hypothetical protein